MSVLTVWAVTGNDIKLWTTEKPADFYFDIVVYVMIAMFSAEIVIECSGKDDYFMGFFFFLDVVSTLSLFLDLAWCLVLIMELFESIGQFLGDEDTGNDVRNVRASKSARFGAKVGRTLRVVRLLRVIKLYKVYSEKNSRRFDAGAELHMEEWRWKDDWEDDMSSDWAETEHEFPLESRVGKRLSELTIRRIIFLVLSALLILPLLQSDEVMQTSASVDYAADEIYRSFRQFLETGSRLDQDVYEDNVLTFFYYHNWFAECLASSCPAFFLGHTIWVGVRTPSSEGDRLHDLAQRALLRRATVDSFQRRADTGGFLYNMQSMPREAVSIMQQPWSLTCSDGRSEYRGMSLLQEEYSSPTRSVRYVVRCPEEDLRLGEFQEHVPRQAPVDDLANWTVVTYSDLRRWSQEEARGSILLTCFVCFLLVMAAMLFAHDLETIILGPVANMMRRVEAIRDDPRAAVRMADDAYRAEEQAQARLDRRVCVRGALSRSFIGRKAQEPLETAILEKTIIKLGSLLAVGLGEAGARIIRGHMRNRSSLNAIFDGVRVECVVGVARVRHFSTATQVLQTSIMRFINQVAEIVHGVVVEYHGAPNTNFGETFLLIWRCEGLDSSSAALPITCKEGGIVDTTAWAEPSPPSTTPLGASATSPTKADDNLIRFEDHAEATPHQRHGESPQWHRTRVAELSVCAFCKILGEVHQSPVLAQYRTHPILGLLLGAECRVDMSFGLHFGWAIEGAVGSEFKIDASYVSPNVSIASSVESATDIYKVPILVTESVARLCGIEIFEKLRLIDRVMIPGSTRPMDLFSMDLHAACLPVAPAPQLTVKWNSRNRFFARERLEAEKAKKWARDFQAVTLLDLDPQFVAMRGVYTVEFMQLYRMGFYNYVEGEWRVAARMFECTRKMLGLVDGPSAAVLDFMALHLYQAGEEWNGVRELSC